MRRLFIVMLTGILLVSVGASFAQEFPTAPPNIKEVEAKGLPRASTEELKAYFPGVVDWKGTRARRIITHNADGTLVSKGFKAGLDVPGKWRIDEKNNTYCKEVPQPQQGTGVMTKGMYKEYCFAVFRAPDGTSFFDYDVQDGYYVATWRKAAEQ